MGPEGLHVPQVVARERGAGHPRFIQRLPQLARDQRPNTAGGVQSGAVASTKCRVLVDGT